MQSISPRVEEIRTGITESIPDRKSALMLFGSVARGDASAASDVDVLQLLKKTRPSYRVGRVNVSTYDEGTLLSMAKSGSLFVLHLRREGVIIRDPGGRLLACLKAYVEPSSYGHLRSTLAEAANLLDVPPAGYEKRWEQYHQLSMYLLRTALYARFAEMGEPTFALQNVKKRIGREDLERALALRAASRPQLHDFVLARRLLEEFLDTRVHNPFGTVEALLTNRGLENSALLSCGLRLLASGDWKCGYGL